MSGKGKQQRPQGRREVSTTVAPPIVQAKAPPAPEATTLPFTELAEPHVVEVVPLAREALLDAPAAPGAIVVPTGGAGGGLSTVSPFTKAATFVDPSPRQEPLKPCRRGHVRAKVLVHGLQATGYALDGEYRTKWSKGDEGEFPRESVDGIYLEAL